MLDGALVGREWPVGDKMTIADLAFVPWNERVDAIFSRTPESKFDGFPRVAAWHARMTARPAWRRAMSSRDRLMDDMGLLPNGMPKSVGGYDEHKAKIAAVAAAAAAGEDTTA